MRSCTRWYAVYRPMLAGRRSVSTIRTHRFKLDRDEIWQQDCSTSKYASIDRIVISRWRPWRHFTQKSAAIWWVTGSVCPAPMHRLSSCSWSLAYSYLLSKHQLPETFSARQHAERADIARPCLTVTLVDQSKTVRVRIMQLSPQSSPISLVFAVYYSKLNMMMTCLIQKRWAGRQQGWGGEKKLLSSFMRRYLENGTRYDQSYY